MIKKQAVEKRTSDPLLYSWCLPSSVCESAVQQPKNGQTCSFFHCLITNMTGASRSLQLWHRRPPPTLVGERRRRPEVLHGQQVRPQHRPRGRRVSGEANRSRDPEAADSPLHARGTCMKMIHSYIYCESVKRCPDASSEKWIGCEPWFVNQVFFLFAQGNNKNLVTNSPSFSRRRQRSRQDSGDWRETVVRSMRLQYHAAQHGTNGAVMFVDKSSFGDNSLLTKCHTQTNAMEVTSVDTVKGQMSS